jgi:hypothetical protein
MYIVAVGAVLVYPDGCGACSERECSDWEAGITDQSKNFGSDGSGAVEARAGDIFGELALFPDLSGPTRLNSAVGLASSGLLYALPMEAVVGLAERYPELVARMRALCVLEAINSRAHGDAGCKAKKRQEAARRRAGLRAGMHPCRIQTRIAQLKVLCIPLSLSPTRLNNRSHFYLEMTFVFGEGTNIPFFPCPTTCT